MPMKGVRIWQALVLLNPPPTWAPSTHLCPIASLFHPPHSHSSLSLTQAPPLVSLPAPAGGQWSEDKCMKALVFLLMLKQHTAGVFIMSAPTHTFRQGEEPLGVD